MTLQFYLLEDGRVVAREHEPRVWLERYHDLEEMRGCYPDAVFRAKLMSVADDMTMRRGEELPQQVLQGSGCQTRLVPG